jgi:HEXXH motif-containing protein
MPAHERLVVDVRQALRAAVLHGRDPGALDELRDLCAAAVAARLVLIPAAARGAGLRADLVDEVESLVRALVARPAAWLRGILEEPLVRVWLVDVEIAIARRDPTAPERLTGLVWLCAVYLEGLVPGAHRWHVALPVDGRCSPIGADIAVSAATRQLAVLTVEPGMVTVAGPRRVVFEVSGDRLHLVDAGDAHAAARRWAIFGIEVLDVTDIPELARVDVDTGVPLPSATADVDGPLTAAIELVDAVWPEALVDVVATVRAIVPLDAPRGHVYNTSSGSAPGITQLTIRDGEDPLVLAETIVHEAAHLKFDALWDVAPFLDSAERPLIRHPWLDEPRPLRGALLGAQAFLNVAELDRRAAALGIDPTYTGAQHRAHVDEVGAVLDMITGHEALTPMGTAVVAELRSTLPDLVADPL